jgi:hypothetical protein
MKKYFLVTFCLLATIIFGQSLYKYPVYRISTIPIYHGSDSLYHPFSGGTNTPIINHSDLNGDGFKDIVIKDNTSGKYITMINNKIPNSFSYKYDPKYESGFLTSKATGRIALKDYNNDGLDDLFEAQNNSIYLYKAYSGSNGLINYSPAKELKYYPANSQNFRSNIPCYVNNMPIFYDVDFDGDIDVLATSDGESVVFYKNFNKEKNLPVDSFLFYIDNYYWGQYKYTMSPLRFRDSFYKMKVRHSVATTGWLIDVDHNDLVDIVLYDETQNNSPLGLNTGTKDSAFIDSALSDIYFPSNTKSINKWAGVGTWSDFDNDNKKDFLLYSLLERDNFPLPGMNVYNSDVKTIDFYANKGSMKRYNKLIDSFVYQNNDALTKGAIDVGSGSQPLFFDYNFDGKKDLIIANYYNRDTVDKAYLTLYENVGTNYKAKYIRIDTNYLNLKSIGYNYLRLAFDDLNNDSIPDMILIYKKPSSSQLFIDYYINTPVSGKSSFVLSSIKFKVATQYIRDFEYPCLFDYNQDGKKDLIIGDNYKIVLYLNSGTALQPMFDSFFTDTLMYYADFLPYLSDYSFSPRFVRDSVKNATFCYFGYSPYDENTGKIAKAIILPNTKRMKIIDSSVIPASLGKLLTIDIADINKDSLIEFLLGNAGGGVQLYSYGDYDNTKEPIIPNPPNSILPSSTNSIFVYPNPVSDLLNISLDHSSKVTYEVSNILGVKVLQGSFVGVSHQISWSELPQGIYFLQLLEDQRGSQVVKIEKK